jgi:glutaredoxin
MTTDPTASTSNASDAATLRLYWQPGCSSCVKLKEFLTASGVDFISVNILEKKGSMDELLRRGIRSVPVLLQGDRMTYGQSLNDVAAFVGKKRGTERLPPRVLFEKWLQFLTSARELITSIPEDKLEYRPIPERPRTTRELAYHIFQIPESVLESVENGLKDTRDISNAKYDHIQTGEQLRAYADGILKRMKDWQASVDEAWFTSTVETYYGEQPAMQVLERGTWHSGQHTRQLDLVVSKLTGGSAVVPPDTYTGLPMPVGIWE